MINDPDQFQSTMDLLKILHFLKLNTAEKASDICWDTYSDEWGVCDGCEYLNSECECSHHNEDYDYSYENDYDDSNLTPCSNGDKEDIKS